MTNSNVLHMPKQAEPESSAYRSARAAATVGVALSNAQVLLDDQEPFRVTAGNRYWLAQQVMTTVVGYMATRFPGMTLAELKRHLDDMGGVQ